MAKQNDIVTKLEDINKGLPALPKNIKDLLVMLAPWFALVAGILGVFGILSAFGLMSVFGGLGLAMGMNSGFNGIFYVYLLVGLVTSVLDLMAFPSLRMNKMKGWNYLLWSEALSLVVNVVSFNIVGVLFSLVYLYLLLQIKSYYK